MHILQSNFDPANNVCLFVCLFVHLFYLFLFCHTTDNNTKIISKEIERRRNDGNSGEEA